MISDILLEVLKILGTATVILYMLSLLKPKRRWGEQAKWYQK